MRNVLIDGDICVYNAGFAAQKESLDIPVQHAYQALKYKLAFIEDRVPGRQIIVLSGDTNFRNDLATTKKYKGNRTQERPVHYKALRNHIIAHYDFVLSNNCEGDDVLGYMQTDDSVIVSLDKDLNMIPGWHYNWNTDKMYEVSKNQAWYCFCYQLLVGDTVDNIPGLPGIGPIKATKLLSEVKRDSDFKKNLFSRVYEAYIERNELQLLKEQASLVWIMRKEGEVFNIEEALCQIEKQDGQP